MTTTTISSLNTSGVILGNGTYGVDITPTGKIVTAYGIIGDTSASYASISNAGTINAVTLGIVIGAAATILNTGSIYGTDAGIFLSAGSLTNAGSISGKTTAVFISGYASSITTKAFFTNTSRGHVTATELGVSLNPYGTQSIIFDNAGTVSGQIGGVYAANATLNNAGLITSSTYAVYLQGGQVSNSGTIASMGAGISINQGSLSGSTTPIPANINNGGIISGGFAGITNNTTTNLFPGNATLENTGTIEGGTTGIALAQGTIFNAGLIAGGTDAIYATAALQIFDQGGSFKGAVTDAADQGTLILTGTATALDIATSFTGFSHISFTGSALALEAGSIAIAAGQTISGFSYGDTIILDNFTANTANTTYITGTGLELTSTSGTHLTLDITGNHSTASFIIIDHAGETAIEALCYLRGTRIATPAGEIPIEQFNIGDTVITRFSGYRKIKWIGRQSFAPRFIANNPDQLPIRITAGALGRDMPACDLFISPGHSMLIGKQLILAKNLVNGITILQPPAAEDVNYLQLEFETHDCILAEGAWSESYADSPGLRAQFHNAAEFHQTFPHHIAPAAQSLCAPRPLAGPALEAALTPLAAHAASLTRPGPLHGHIDAITGAKLRGWAWDESNPHLPVLLDIRAGNHWLGQTLACQPRPDLKAAGYAQGHHGFEFISPIGLPADLTQIQIRRAHDGALVRPQTRQVA